MARTPSTMLALGTQAPAFSLLEPATGLEGKQFPDEQIASLGCNIKWKAGNEPDYSV